MRRHRIRSIHEMAGVRPLPDGWSWPFGFEDARSRAVKGGSCLWCGGATEPRKRYCGKWYCRLAVRGTAPYDLKITSARRYVHKFFGFRCTRCRLPMLRVAPGGIPFPMHLGHVDHVVALINGGTESFDNLQLLCEPCHKVKTTADLELHYSLRERVARAASLLPGPRPRRRRRPFQPYARRPVVR